MPWRAELVRLTLFEHREKICTPPYWRSLTGEDPTESHTKAGETRELGAFGPGTLIVLNRPQRFDVTIVGDQTIKFSDGAPPPPFSTVDTLSRTFDAISPALINWLQARPAIKRLALGVTLLSEVPGPDGIIADLQQHLPHIPLTGVSAQDFGYTVNRPVRSKSVAGVEINRIRKWAGLAVQLIKFQATVGLGQPVARQEDQHAGFAARLEMDINTAPMPDLVLQPNQLVPLFEEFKELALQTEKEGDV